MTSKVSKMTTLDIRIRAEVSGLCPNCCRNAGRGTKFARRDSAIQLRQFS